MRNLIRRALRRMRAWINEVDATPGDSNADEAPVSEGPAGGNDLAPYVDVHPSAILGPSAVIQVTYRPHHPGTCVRVGADSQIFGVLVVQRPGATITIGERCQIGASNLIAACSIEVGDDVLMAWNVTLMDNDSHALDWQGRKNDVAQCAIDYHQTPQDFTRNKDWSHVAMGPIKVEAKAWIGFGASILKGVTIGEGAVVGAGSVVTRDVAPYTLVAGNPARAIRALDQNGNL